MRAFPSIPLIVARYTNPKINNNKSATCCHPRYRPCILCPCVIPCVARRGDNDGLGQLTHGFFFLLYILCCTPRQGLRIPDSLPELQSEGSDSANHNGVATAATATTAASTSRETPEGEDGAGAGGETETGGSRKRRKTDNNDNNAMAKGDVKPKPKWHFSAAGSGGAGGGKGVEAGGGGEGSPSARTAILHHPLCLEHHSCPPIRRSSGEPPPENVKRLEVIYNEVRDDDNNDVVTLAHFAVR